MYMQVHVLSIKCPNISAPTNINNQFLLQSVCVCVGGGGGGGGVCVYV